MGPDQPPAPSSQTSATRAQDPTQSSCCFGSCLTQRVDRIPCYFVVSSMSSVVQSQLIEGLETIWYGVHYLFLAKPYPAVGISMIEGCTPGAWYLPGKDRHQLESLKFGLNSKKLF